MSEEWSRYWARETSGACLPGAPESVQNALIGVWKQAIGDQFVAKVNKSLAIRVLDVASGGGAVLKILLEGRKNIVGTGIDAANVGPAAAALGVRGGIDAHHLPFADASFEIVTSQFGLEYCRREAWAEAVRVLAPGGSLVLICHHRDSMAVRHNAGRLAAMQALAQAGLFALADAMAVGQAEDAGAVARVIAARNAHKDQAVVAELPAALGHWARAGRRDAVAAIRAETEAEMARLAAMGAAALDAAAIGERLSWLAPVAAQAEVLPGPEAPIGWLVSGGKG